MAEYAGGKEKLVNVDEPIIFENKTDSNYEVSAGIVFHKGGVYEVSIEGYKTTISKISEPKQDILSNDCISRQEIIICRNCKYGSYELARPNKYHPGDAAFPAHWRCHYYKNFIPIVSPDDFCSKAERRTDERSD